MESKRATRKFKELEEAENWDLKTQVKAEPHQQTRRVLVSVPFQKEEFDRVSRAASSNEIRISVFIRTAALEKTEKLEESHIYFVEQEEECKIISGGRVFTLIYEGAPQDYNQRFDIGRSIGTEILTETISK